MRQFMLVALVCCAFQVQAATQVVTKPLSELVVEVRQSAPAEVVNDNHVWVSSRLNAQIESVQVKVGDQVEAGQPLLEFECHDFDLNQQQASAQLQALQAQGRLARQQLNRAARLLKQKNASIELRDQRRAELDSLQAQQQGAKARLAEADLAIARCTLRGPVAGVVTATKAAPGAFVNQGVQLLRLLAHQTQEVSATLNSEQISDLQQSTEIFYQLGDMQFPVQLRAVVPLVDSRARTQELRLVFMADAALSGSSGRLLWQEAKPRLPIQYVVSRAGQLGVMRVVADKAEFVQLPQAVEGQAVKVGLAADTVIIVEGQHSVSTGDDVTLAK